MLLFYVQTRFPQFIHYQKLWGKVVWRHKSKDQIRGANCKAFEEQILGLGIKIYIF